MSYPGLMVEPSIIQLDMLVARQCHGAADILLLSSPRDRTGVFFCSPPFDNRVMQNFDAAARQLLELESGRLPDLSTVTVLVPHLHATPMFMQALSRRQPGIVLLPPRLTTLPALARSAVDRGSCEPASRRVSRLAAFLRRFDWVPEAAMWPLAYDLMELLDEMDAALLSPPRRYGDFMAQVLAVARRFVSAPLERESELVFQVWQAFGQEALTQGKDYAARLARWAETAPGPLYRLGLTGLSPLEQRFLQQCAEAGLVKTLSVAAPFPERELFFSEAWQGDASATLRDRALAWCDRRQPSPIAGTVAFFAADTLEAEAVSAANRIQTWFAQGRRSIGIVALDRLVARRLRAILERDRILIQDETGWTFATSSASAVLDRWFSLLAEGAYFRDVLDLLKSPFVFADTPLAARLDALPEFERELRRREVVRGLPALRRVAQHAEAVTVATLIGRMEQAQRDMQVTAVIPLARWLTRLLEVLECLGVAPAWQGDPVGRQLLALLGRLRGELSDDPARYDFRQWRLWFESQLDRALFQETGIESPIRLTHLHLARYRAFETLIVLGADGRALPQAGHAGMFNEAMRRQLDLPGLAEQRKELRSVLADVLCGTEQVLVTWQRELEGEPNPPSPWLESARAFHRLAYGADLVQPKWPTSQEAGAGEPEPLPDWPKLKGLPARLSASGWQSLVQCPYQYFARYGLGLDEVEVMPEEMEKREYGELVHAILARLHAEQPELNAVSRAVNVARLQQISDQVFNDAFENHYLARAWQRRWRRQIEAYVDWARDRESAGYRWLEGELVQSRSLALSDGVKITLHGRVDRLEQGPTGRSVVDYKTQSAQVLRAKLKQPGEDVQLAFYGLLTGATEAGLASLEGDRVTLYGLAQDVAEAVRQEEARLLSTLEALGHDAAMPALGAPNTCRWCEMRGLCRKQHRDIDAPLPLSQVKKP